MVEAKIVRAEHLAELYMPNDDAADGPDEVAETNISDINEEAGSDGTERGELFEEATEASGMDGAVSVRPKRNAAVWMDLLILLGKIVVISMAFVMLFTFVFGIIRYHEPSMAPSIKDGDLVIIHRYNKAGYHPQDIIAFDYNGKQQVRRVVATAGDVVDIKEERLYINGALQQEQGIMQKTERYRDGIDFPFKVPEGHVFVLADSRAGATDSRIYGSVSIDETMGKITALIRRRGF